MTDEEIIKLVVNGDREKYGEIINRYEKRLRGFIYKLIGKNLEIDDLVEESLISAYQNLNGFDQKQKFSSWILRIAHNKTVDFIKKKKPVFFDNDEKFENYLPADAKASAFAGGRITNENEKLIEDLEIKKEENKALHVAINKLELKYKEIIVLYYFEEKSYEEISDILHITINNVGVTLMRAREKLKINLNPSVPPLRDSSP